MPHGKHVLCLLHFLPTRYDNKKVGGSFCCCRSRAYFREGQAQSAQEHQIAEPFVQAMREKKNNPISFCTLILSIPCEKGGFVRITHIVTPKTYPKCQSYESGSHTASTTHFPPTCLLSLFGENKYGFFLPNSIVTFCKVPSRRPAEQPCTANGGPIRYS